MSSVFRRAVSLVLAPGLLQSGQEVALGPEYHEIYGQISHPVEMFNVHQTNLS